MNCRRVYTRAVACLAIAASATVQGQRPSSDPVQQLRSADWGQRAKALEALRSKPALFAAPGMAATLLQSLGREMEVIRATLRESRGAVGVSEKYGEGFGEYYSELFEACLTYCENQGLLALMLRDARNGSEAQSSAVELLGVVRNHATFLPQHRRVIDSALVAAATFPESFMVRSAGLTALGNVLQANRSVAPEDKLRMRGAIVGATKDAYSSVRMAAVSALGDLRDPNDLPLLRQIAGGDTAQSVNQGKVNFPVRDQARRAIAKIPPSTRQ
jgi:hypothetical protein